MTQQTSLWAYESVKATTKATRETVLAQIKRYPSTCDELEVTLRACHQSCSARVSELSNSKNDPNVVALIRDSGKKRKTRRHRPAIVWEAVP